MHQRTGAIAAVVLTIALVGCSKSENATPAASPGATPTAEKAAPGLTGPTGTIEVRVTYPGQSVVEHLSINKDVQACGTTTPIEEIVVGKDGGLAHAVAWVAGIEGPPPAKTPQIDQHGCQFQPHVLAMHTGQLEVLNSDGVLHNLHTYSKLNPQINRAQPKFKKEMTVDFEQPEVVKLTCDVHSWMRGWLVVVPSDYFGVTDESGTTRIESVPVGSHTVQAWQEKLGRRSKDVTVKAGETVHVDFAYPKAG